MTTGEMTRAVKAEIGKARIFGAEFTTRKGKIRTGSFRLGVKPQSAREGGGRSKPNYATDDYGNIIAYDMGIGAYRTIPLARLHWLKVRGKKIMFNQEQ